MIPPNSFLLAVSLFSYSIEMPSSFMSNNTKNQGGIDKRIYKISYWKLGNISMPLVK